MDHLPLRNRTMRSRRWLRRPDAGIERIHQALLSTIDGHRTVIELESVAQVMGLDAAVLERLRRQGDIDLITHGASAPARGNAPFSAGRATAVARTSSNPAQPFGDLVDDPGPVVKGDVVPR